MTLPTVDELMTAPELAVLGAIEAAIDLALVALVAALPELQETPDRRLPVVMSAPAELADDVIVKAQALAAAIADYRTARLRRHCTPL